MYYHIQQFVKKFTTDKYILESQMIFRKVLKSNSKADAGTMIPRAGRVENVPYSGIKQHDISMESKYMGINGDGKWEQEQQEQQEQQGNQDTKLYHQDLEVQQDPPSIYQKLQTENQANRVDIQELPPTNEQNDIDYEKTLLEREKLEFEKEKLKYDKELFEKQKENDEKFMLNDENETGIRFSLKNDKEGYYVEVDTDQYIFEGITNRRYPEIIKTYLNEKFANKKIKEFTIKSKNIGKLAYPGKKQAGFDKKMMILPELENIINAMWIVAESGPTHKNSKYSKYEYYRFNFTVNGEWFNALVNVGIKDDSSKYIYEINRINYNRLRFNNKTISPQKNNNVGIIPIIDDSNLIIPTNKSEVNSNEKNNLIENNQNDSTRFSFLDI